MAGIICTVTNDLTYDQRMQRICTTLVAAGYDVTLVGRSLPQSVPLESQPYKQKRLSCFFKKGPLFYAAYNIRLFFYLMTTPCDGVCSVDLDSLPAGCLATLLRGKKRIFDAHEHFTEVPEVTDRKIVKSIWEAVARICLLFYKTAYTVGPGLASIFEQQYRLPFAVVRNVPFLDKSILNTEKESNKNKKIILYQGALNEGRGIEALLTAMQQLEGVELWLAGEGDLSAVLRQMAQEMALGDKVRFLGFVKPRDLKAITQQAWLGVNLLENKGLSYYYSLANKFFDYVQALVPVVTMNFPEYRHLNTVHEVAILLEEAHPDTIAGAISTLQNDPAKYEILRENALQARLEWHWDAEKTELLACYDRLFKK